MMLIRQIMRGEYTMVGPDWAEVTVETKELVSLDLLEWKWLPSSTLVAFAKSRRVQVGYIGHQVLKCRAANFCRMTTSLGESLITHRIYTFTYGKSLLTR